MGAHRRAAEGLPQVTVSLPALPFSIAPMRASEIVRSSGLNFKMWRGALPSTRIESFSAEAPRALSEGLPAEEAVGNLILDEKPAEVAGRGGPPVSQPREVLPQRGHSLRPPPRRRLARVHGRDHGPFSRPAENGWFAGKKSRVSGVRALWGQQWIRLPPIMVPGGPAAG